MVVGIYFKQYLLDIAGRNAVAEIVIVGCAIVGDIVIYCMSTLAINSYDISISWINYKRHR
jgi:hypothetical protein